MKTKHFFFYFLFINLNLLNGQDISNSAINNTIEFLHSEGYTSGDQIALEPGWMGSTSWKSAQLIYNNGSDSGDGDVNRLTVKRKFQRSQKNQPLQANSGEIITLKMIFRPNGTANAFDAVDGIASGQLFAFGLKDSFDTSDTQPATTANGEVIGIEIDADNKLGIQYKVDTPQLYSYNYWNSLTIKFFVGNNLNNSSIKIKLEHNTGTESMLTSGWLDHTWDSQSLYNAVIGNGAYMIFQSGNALGTDTSATQIYIDKYSFHTGDSGQLFLEGGLTSAGSWSGGTSPSSSDRLFIFNKSPNLENGMYDFECSYLFIDSNSTFNVTKSNSINIDNISLDGVLNILTFNNEINSAIENNINVNNNLSINGTLNISPASSLSVSGNFTNNGTVTLNSDADEFSRMMVGGTVSGSGTYKYQKYVAGSSTNDLITAPFSGEEFSNLVDNNSGVLVTNTSPTTEYLFGPFDNDDGVYLTYDSTTNASTVLFAGQGYRAGTASGTTLEFTGDFQTTDQTVAISVGSHETYGKWNLVGNPFPSYLDLAGFISDNSAILEDVNNAVYAYDGDDSDGSNWTIYHSSNSSGVAIAPGQAFFVASSSGGGDLNFNTSRQTVTGGDDFLQRQAQTTDSSFKLNLQSNNALTHTDFYFNSNAGEGLDIGYDVGTYANLASSFSLYSKLASGEYSETNFAIQTISNDLSETVIIPLGVHTSVGESHSISIEDVSLLESINVYLKDYETGALTLLNNGAYSFSTDSNLEGISRFELRLTNTTLGIESDELITNFKAVYQNGGVILVGDFILEDKVEIYDIMGRLTQTHTIKGNHSIEITKDELAIGVYLAKINREGNSKTIKLIIN